MKCYDAIKGRELAFVLLAGPGVGKSALVTEIHSALARQLIFSQSTDGMTGHEKKLQLFKSEQELVESIAACVSKKSSRKATSSVAKIPLVFLDEFHVRKADLDQFGLMLTALEDNVLARAGWSPRPIAWMFAMSAYLSRDDFVNEAMLRKSQTMLDFATRIDADRWVEIPELALLPIQKILVYTSIVEHQAGVTEFAEHELLAIAMSPRCQTARDVTNIAMLRCNAKADLHTFLRDLRSDLGAVWYDGMADRHTGTCKISLGAAR